MKAGGRFCHDTIVDKIRSQLDLGVDFGSIVEDGGSLVPNITSKAARYPYKFRVSDQLHSTGHQIFTFYRSDKYDLVAWSKVQTFESGRPFSVSLFKAKFSPELPGFLVGNFILFVAAHGPHDSRPEAFNRFFTQNQLENRYGELSEQLRKLGSSSSSSSDGGAIKLILFQGDLNRPVDDNHVRIGTPSGTSRQLLQTSPTGRPNPSYIGFSHGGDVRRDEFGPRRAGKHFIPDGILFWSEEPVVTRENEVLSTVGAASDHLPVRAVLTWPE